MTNYRAAVMTETGDIPSAYFLAGMADCASPNTPESAGAVFLTRVAHDTLAALDYVDAVTDERETEDIPSEVADAAVPIYTHNVWATFTDLAAWQEDPTELMGGEFDMEQAAKVSLYMIAERLVWALLAEIRQAAEDAEG